MKNILKISLALFTTSLVLNSCGPKDPPAATGFVVDAANLQGTIASTDGTVTLKSGTTYKLTGALIVESGATLKIEPGTIVEAQGSGTGEYIAIIQGGKIDAQGTATSPVVLTSLVKTQASWGGLVICGKAPINNGATAQAEVTGFVYGGTDAADNSGILKYVRVEYCGAKINSEKEFNGFTFFGVGSGTTVSYCEAYTTSDDGFEFFGGTVSCDHLLAINNEDDGFDWTEGWQGGINYGYSSVATITNASDDSRGIEADNLELNFAALPISNPTLSNISLIGRNAATTTGAQKEAVKLRRGTKGKLSNIYMQKYSKGFGIEHDETIAFWVSGALSTTKYDTVSVTKLGETVTTAPTGGTATTTNISSTLTTDATTTGADARATFPTWAAGWGKQ